MEKDYLINKWLNEGLSESEMEEFRRREDYDELMTILEQAKLFRASNFSEVDSYKKFEEQLGQKSSAKKSLFWIRPLMRIAAVLVLGLAIFFYLSGDDSTRIATLAGEKRTVELPDASTVVVNALSEIRYDQDTWQQDRMIELKGEAFFEVVNGGSFVVNTSSGTVRVLGTEFNVKQRAGYFEVHCFEGRVEVVSGSIKEIVEAGERLQLSEGNLELGNHTHTLPGWTQNMSSFQKVPYAEVIEELERQYNVQVSFKEMQPNTLFTGAFVHGDLEQALISITEPMNLQYTLETNKKVSIYPRE